MGDQGLEKLPISMPLPTPAQIAAEVPDFDPTDYMDPKTAKRLDRFVHLSLASASMALEDSEIEIPFKDPYRIGVFVGTAIGGGEDM